MKIADVPPSAIERVKQLRYDRIIEKHEGPESWDSYFEYYDVPDPLRVDGMHVLLPVDAEQMPHIRVLRHRISADGSLLTLFLIDRSILKPHNEYGYDAEEEAFVAGRLAICERLGDGKLYVATVYHEWFITEPVNGDWDEPARSIGTDTTLPD